MRYWGDGCPLKERRPTRPIRLAIRVQHSQRLRQAQMVRVHPAFSLALEHGVLEDPHLLKWPDLQWIYVEQLLCSREILSILQLNDGHSRPFTGTLYGEILLRIRHRPPVFRVRLRVSRDPSAHWQKAAAARTYTRQHRCKVDLFP